MCRGTSESHPSRPGDLGKTSWKGWCLRRNLKYDKDYCREDGMVKRNATCGRTDICGGTKLG